MKKFGDLSMLTRTLFHGNKEEFSNHIQPTDGSTHQADMKLQLVVRLLHKNQTKRRILEIRTLMKRFGDSSTLTRTPNHGKAEEFLNHIQLMDGPIHQADFLSVNNQSKILHKEILQTKKSDQMFGPLFQRMSLHLPTGDQTRHQLLGVMSHTKELLQFQSSLIQAGKIQMLPNQQKMKQYKLNSLATQRELTSSTQLPTKPEPTETLLTVASKSEEPLSTTRNTVSGWINQKCSELFDLRS